jgi:transketolase
MEALETHKQDLTAAPSPVPTRKASGAVLEVINEALAETIGGSADLTGSVNTMTSGHRPIGRDDFGGRYLHYGVREHAMGAVMNGMALHHGVIPYGGTFLVFSDYARPAMRLSALMGLRVVYVMTHDSIGLGEDGPTHQPVEHLAALRAIPNLNVFRPADAVETTECWLLALESRDTPSVIVLTRQNVPLLRTEHRTENLCSRGGYELMRADGEARVTLIGTGSEVGLAVEARALLQAGGIPTRVVSLPCWELFDRLSAPERAQVLGTDTVRVAVEAAVAHGWERYIGKDGAFVGMRSFGASAPAAKLFEHFNITPEAVAAAARERL